VIDSELNLEVFRVREFKHLMEANGHDPMPYLKEQFAAFKQKKQTWAIV
jgi:hypothetical protein